MAAEMIFSKLLSEEGHLFATPSWYYSTEFRVIYTQLIMAPLFKIFQSFHIIRALTNIASYLLMLAAYFYMMKPFKVKRRYTLLTGAILLLPFSETMMTHMQMGNTYMVHVIIALFFLGIFIRLAHHTRLHIIIYILMAVICGLSGVRYLLALQAPLLIAAFVYMLKSKEFAAFRESLGTNSQNIAEDNVKNSFKCMLRSEEAKLFYYSVAGAAAAVAGYGINILYISRKYVFQTYEATNFIPVYQGVLMERIQNAFGSLIMLLGYIPDRSVISLRGIISLASFVFLALLIYFTVNGCRECHGIRLFIAIFAVAAFGLNTFVFVFTTSTLVPRYYITIFIFVLPVIAFYFDSSKNRLDRSAAAVVLAAVLFLGSAKTTLSFITVDKNASKRDVAEFLIENGYDFGYATYWNANILTELTDGKVETANILDPESMTYFTWSTPVKYYNDDYSDGRVFMLLTREEAEEYSECSAVSKGEQVFENSDYIVYSYENAKELISCGDSGAAGFR
jgi:hypothetical protein